MVSEMETEKKLVWVTNDVAELRFFEVVRLGHETQQEAYMRHLEWRKQFVVGRPMKDGKESDELALMGMVGLYKEEKEPCL